MWYCKHSVILESKKKFDETYMKMSKYENSVFPYSIYSTVNLSACIETERWKCYFERRSCKISRRDKY